jgi:hypothetical protein
MPLDFLFFNENIPSIISLSVILKSSSEKNCSSSSLLRYDLSRDNKTTSPDIANITWFNYFQELNDNKLNAPNSDIEKDLKRLEEEQIFSELDFKITDKEIIKGIEIFQFLFSSFPIYFK